MANTTSSQFSVSWSDLFKGALVAAITAPISILLESLNAGSFKIDWKHTAAIGLAGFLSYIVKNFLTPSKITITDPTTVKAVKEGDAEVKIVNK